MDSKRFYDAVGNSNNELTWSKIFTKTLSHIDLDGTLLDVGCGQGSYLSFLYEKTNLKLTGTEVSPVRLDAAKKNLNGLGIDLALSDILNLPYESNSFNHVTALEVLEHVPDWKTGLCELVRVASDKVIVTVPYKENRVSTTCKNCDATIYQSGHLHSMSEKDFLEVDFPVSIKDIQFGRIYMDYSALFHNIKKRIKNATVKSAAAVNSVHTEYTCPSCYSYGTPTKEMYVKRFGRMAIEIATFSPHWLLVEIKK